MRTRTDETRGIGVLACYGAMTLGQGADEPVTEFLHV